MKIGTKTTFGKLKVGDRFRAIDNDTKKAVRLIKTDGDEPDGQCVGSDGKMGWAEQGEAVTYLGRGF